MMHALRPQLAIMVMTIVALVGARSLSASESHCADVVVTEPDGGPQQSSPEAWSAFDPAGESCQACIMPDCPLGMGWGGIPLPSEPALVVPPFRSATLRPVDGPAARSRFLQPPTPPPNTPRFVA